MYKLKMIMEELGIQDVDLQEALQLSRKSMYNKMNGVTQWQLNEIITITDYINKKGLRHVDGFRRKTIDELFRG